MNEFINYEFDISKIYIACHVLPGKEKIFHTNRPFHGIVLKLKGETKYWFENGKTLTTKENDILYLPKGSTYSAQITIDGSSYAINFDFYSQATFAPFSFPLKNPSPIFDYFKSSEHIWSNKKPYYKIKCMANLYNILYKVMSEYTVGYLPSDKSDKITPAVEYIHSNYYTTNNIKISTLAQLCNVSETYFRSIFIKRFSVLPVKYINELRLIRAKELLETSEYSVSEVAMMSGFKDESYFSREFKKRFELRPIDIK